jgi:hypothetical protein
MIDPNRTVNRRSLSYRQDNNELISPSALAMRHSQPVEQIEFVLCAPRLRCGELMGDRRLQAVISLQVSWVGHPGRSLRRLHWQFVATPVMRHLL